MALKELVIHYVLPKEKHQVAISKCPGCLPVCEQTKVLELPVFKSNCSDCTQSVAVKLKDSALVVQPCVSAGQKVIRATVLSWTQLVDTTGCYISEYLIYLEYDDAQIVDAQLITENDVDFWDCFTPGDDYLIAKFNCLGASELTQDLETGEITLTNGNGDTSTAQVTSADAGNLISTGTDGGSYLSEATVPTTVYEVDTDTDAVSVDVTAPGAYTIDTGGLINMINPSSYGTMRLLKMVNMAISGNFIPNHAGNLAIWASVNGGAYGLIAAKSWKNSGATDWVGDLPIGFDFSEADTLVAVFPATYTIQYRLIYTTSTQGSGGSGTSTVSNFLNSARILGYVGNNT